MRRFARILLATAVLVFVVWLFRERLLTPLGEFLISSDEPVKSDCLLVLAGDYSGRRVLRAGDLYRKGFTSRVFVSGQFGFYGQSESAMAIAFARSKGFEDVPYQDLTNSGTSTVSELMGVEERLRQQGCHSLLLVTSDFHTRRARAVAQRYLKGVQIRVVAAVSREFETAEWWKYRESRKTVFYEWTKTIAYWLGM